MSKYERIIWLHQLLFSHPINVYLQGIYYNYGPDDKNISFYIILDNGSPYRIPIINNKTESNDILEIRAFYTIMIQNFLNRHKTLDKLCGFILEKRITLSTRQFIQNLITIK